MKRCTFLTISQDADMTYSMPEIARREPNRQALVFAGNRWNYGRLDHFSAQLAALLWHRGLKQGDVVALLMGNHPEFLASAWAAQRSGLYYLPIPTNLTAGEVRYILTDSGARAFIVSPEYGQTGLEAVHGLDALCFSVANNEGFESLSANFGHYEAAPAIEGGDMLYTSGTTGRPKGVRRPIVGEALGIDGKRVVRGKALFGFGPDTVFLSSAPLYHAAPLRFAMNLLRVGATVVGMPKFDPVEALRLIATENITHSQWVPAMFARMLALPEEVRRSVDTSSHICAIHAGAPCSQSIKRSMINWWGPILSEYYSSSESIGFTHITSEEWLQRPGSVGRAYGCTVHILDGQGFELPAGATGDVYFEGKSDFEYHNDPEKTQAAMTDRGWATMGDIGHLDQDGFLYLTDRKNFTIISGGVNVYPSEVEAALMEHKAVRDCAVFGLPDADLGEVVAVIVDAYSSDGPHDIPLANRIFGDLRSILAGPKLPRLWRFDDVSRTETGKVFKQKLRDASLRQGRMVDLRTQNFT
jgi:long-chain acyl-CoA synthetase